MAQNLETKMLNADEKNTCDICKNVHLKEDVFLIGVQDPVNNSVALLRICRTDFVILTRMNLRVALDRHWYAS